MKKTYLLLAFLATTIGFSQTLETLKADTKKMYEASYIMNYDEVTNFTYPKVFDLIPKEKMLEMLEQTFNNETMRIRLVTVDPKFVYSDIQKIENKNVAVVNYNNAMRIIFEQKMTDEEGTKMVENFKSAGNYLVANFEKERNALYLEGPATMIAVADKTTKNEWKFLNYEKGQSQMATTVLGESLVTKLKL
ncbi:MAG: hypothetical protein ACI9XR_000976 [Flavobacterium sp.]|jgi:hypothetical protein